MIKIILNTKISNSNNAIRAVSSLGIITLKDMLMKKKG
jgi:hypothetical protein